MDANKKESEMRYKEKKKRSDKSAKKAAKKYN
jgi:hypothetical protein